jgi:hypothetical protein
MSQLVTNASNSKSARRRQSRPEQVALVIDRVEHLILELKGPRTTGPASEQIAHIAGRLASLEVGVSKLIEAAGGAPAPRRPNGIGLAHSIDR